MDQEVAHPAPRDGDRAGGRRAAAAEFGGDEGLAERLDRGVEHADGVDLEQLHRIGRVEGAHRRDAARPPAPTGRPVRGGEGQEVERLAAGVEIEHDVGHRRQRAVEVVGDLLGGRAVGRARESCG